MNDRELEVINHVLSRLITANSKIGIHMANKSKYHNGQFEIEGTINVLRLLVRAHPKHLLL